MKLSIVWRQYTFIAVIWRQYTFIREIISSRFIINSISK